MRGFFEQGPEMEFRVTLTKTSYRGNRKAYVPLEVARALKLLKAGGIKIWWVSCWVRRKKELKGCFRFLGLGLIAADFRWPDRSRNCWSCGVDGHTMGSRTRQPRCYLCTTRKEKPRVDHVPGTMRCAAFREATPKKRLGKVAKNELSWMRDSIKKRRRSEGERQVAPQDDPHPEVMSNRSSGVGTHGLETGRQFQWVGLRGAAESHTAWGYEAPL